MNEELIEQMHRMNLHLVILQAELKAVRQCFLRACAASTHLDGVTLNEWIANAKGAELQRQLIELENLNPALAAKLQRLLDQNQ
jgi:hypothetical protein